MRFPLFLLPIVFALPLHAQSFEGTIAMRISAPEGAMELKYLIKGDHIAMTLTAPASAGPIAGAEIRMITDPVAKTMTMLMPLPPGMGGGGFLPPDTKGMKTVTPLDSTPHGAGAVEGKRIAPDIKKLGTSQTIAGMKCDDFEVTENGATTMMCLATGVGHFSYPSLGGGGMGGRGRGGAAPSPAWSRALGGHPGFPLKVWTADGKVAMEVTSIHRGTVPGSTFEIPAGYVDLGVMMGGRRP